MRVGVLLFTGALAWASVAQAKPPVVVELYTSQGCGECAQANLLAGKLAERDGLLPLIFSVDYWDYLGWRDTFARPEFAERQKSYADRWSNPAVFTPQVIVDGRGQAKAGEAKAVDKLIRDAARAERNPPQIRFAGERVQVGSGARLSAPADVWLIRYDPRGQDVAVRRGENQGRTLTYRNVVRELVRLGGWSGKAVSFSLPAASQPELETLVLVQQARGGQVLALLGD